MKSVLLIVAGMLIGAILTWLRHINITRRSSLVQVDLQGQFEKKYAEVQQALAIASERKSIIDKQEQDLIKSREQNIRLEKENATLDEQQKALSLRLSQLDKEAEERHKKTLSEFDLLARRILDEKTKTFDENSQKALQSLIDPLKANIQTFHQNIEKKYDADLRDRTALKQEIRSITDAGKELKNSSESLAKALRGESKAQGKWGELVLRKVLETSGLREGFEFTTEQSYSSYEGNSLRPDVTLHLSNQKKIFIDSKVSLTHYDSYIAADDDFDKLLSLDALESSFRERVKELGAKEYQAIKDVTTLDFVLMFTPIESALSLIVQNFEKKNQKSLFEYAWEKGIIITSPLTLMPILKTIDLCWKAEYQDKHAQRIAQEASGLYDKFARFVVILQKVGDSIEKSNEHFKEAKKSLCEGKGNLIRRTDKIRALLKKKRTIAEELFDDSEPVTLEDDEATEEATIMSPEVLSLEIQAS